MLSQSLIKLVTKSVVTNHTLQSITDVLQHNVPLLYISLGSVLLGVGVHDKMCYDYDL